MEIKTIDNKVVNTDKLPDLRAESIELVENSGIRAFAQKHDGFCYVLLGLKGQPAWATMHLDTLEKTHYFLNVINDLVKQCTDSKWCIIKVENRPIKEIIYE